MKSEAFLEDIIQSILANVQEEKPIGRETISRFKEWIAERITIEKDRIPSSFDDLQIAIQSTWQYGSITNMDANTAAIYGALWFGVSLLEKARINEEEKLERESLIKEVSRNRKFTLALEGMKKYPGIKHGDLAEYCGIDKSNLSQLFSRIKGQQLYRSSNIGREKYYYLSDFGMSILKCNDNDNYYHVTSTAYSHVTSVASSTIVGKVSEQIVKREAINIEKSRETKFLYNEIRMVNINSPSNPDELGRIPAKERRNIFDVKKSFSNNNGRDTTNNRVITLDTMLASMEG